MTGMLPDPVHARHELVVLADKVLDSLARGTGPTKVETQRVDIKEEAGRRDRAGGLLSAEQTNPAAAEHLARGRFGALPTVPEAAPSSSASRTVRGTRSAQTSTRSGCANDWTS